MAGPGNNGGDAIGVATLALLEKIDVKILQGLKKVEILVNEFGKGIQKGF